MLEVADLIVCFDRHHHLLPKLEIWRAQSQHLLSRRNQFTYTITSTSHDVIIVDNRTPSTVTSFWAPPASFTRPKSRTPLLRTFRSPDASFLAHSATSASMFHTNLQQHCYCYRQSPASSCSIPLAIWYSCRSSNFQSPAFVGLFQSNARLVEEWRWRRRNLGLDESKTEYTKVRAWVNSTQLAPNTESWSTFGVEDLTII